MDIANLLQHFRGDVARHVVVHQMLRARGGFRRDDHRQRFVIDRHQLRRVLRRVPVGRDHERHRLARVADHVRGEAALGAAVGEVRMRDQQREVEPAKGEVGGGVNRDHARHAAGGARIDGLDSCMRVGRADKAALERALVDVVGEAPVTAKQTVVFDPLHRCAEPSGRHVSPSARPSPERGEGESSAARFTARRIEA